MSSNSDIFNAVLRQQIFLQRFGSGQGQEYAKVVDKVRRAVKSELLKHDLSKLNKRQLKTIETTILKISDDIYKEANLLVTKDMNEFADYQAGFHKRILEHGVKVPIAAATNAALADEVFEKGINLGRAGTIKVNRALTQFSTYSKRAIITSIRSGIISGDSNREIRNALNVITKGDQTFRANSLLRTITNHVSSSSKAALYKANSDVIKNEKFTAVLDSRTTLICAGEDGNIYEIGKGPHPPLHWNCRSVRTPLIKPEFDVVPDVTTKRSSRGVSGKTTLVDGRVNYNSWLREQPKNFQKEVLGDARTELFRKGELKMDKFTDKNFKTLTLKELKRREPLAFEKAGL
jgi:SPP1 gp7 family putative phage head morphogenesis protein